MEGTKTFEVIGVDYAGPLICQVNNNEEEKAYILLFSYSLSRAIHLELLPDQTTEGFIRSLKRFTARRGRPRKIYSDNAKTFESAARWLHKIMNSERLNDYLAREDITWQFNLSRAPWWGGQFERLVGLVKQAMYKAIGRTSLSFSELEDVLLDVEQTLNNRPLSYVEDDIQQEILTPNSLIFGQINRVPTEEDKHDVEKGDLRKRFKFIQRCKEATWQRWSQEYVRSLRERHNLKHELKRAESKPGDVMMIKGDRKNRGKWTIGVVTNTFVGRDGITRAVELRTSKTTLERAVQHLYPLELSCDIAPKNGNVTSTLNAEANEFRPKRNASAIARVQIENQADFEMNQ